jgi:hypothetical protein
MTRPVAYLEWAKAEVGRLSVDLRLSGAPTRDLFALSREHPLHSTFFEDAEAGLRERLAERHHASPEQFLLAPGTSGANFHALAAFAGEGGEILCESPSYEPLWAIPRLLGRRLRFFEREARLGWLPDPLAVEALLSHDTVAVVLSRPHNPTGVDIPVETLVAFGEMAEAHDLWVLVDEVYLEFLPQAVPAFKLHPRLVSTASLTKVHGLGPLRFGWVAGEPSLMKDIARARDHVEVHPQAPTLALALALWPRLDAFAAEARALAEAGRVVVDELLAARPDLDFSSPPGGLIGTVGWGGDDVALTRRLEADSVGVTPGVFFRAPGGVRIAWGRGPAVVREGLEALLNAIHEDQGAAPKNTQ